MPYQLTARGETFTERLNGLNVLSGFGEDPVDIPNVGPETMTDLTLAEQLGFITITGKTVRFTDRGVRAVGLLQAIRGAQEAIEGAPVNKLQIIGTVNLLESLHRDIAKLVHGLAGEAVPASISLPIPTHQNLETLITANLVKEVGK